MTKKSLILISLSLMIGGFSFASNSDQAPILNMVNPASKFCVDKGGKIEIRKAEDGGEYGMCIFKDGTEKEEWAYFRENNAQQTGNNNILSDKEQKMLDAFLQKLDAILTEDPQKVNQVLSKLEKLSANQDLSEKKKFVVDTIKEYIIANFAS